METSNDHAAGPYAHLDFSDLGFDVARHRESLGAFVRLNLDARSVKPALRAREGVFVRAPSGSFYIGVSQQDPTALEAAERSEGCREFAVICRADTGTEATLVRNDVERYFLRHFPGRTLLESRAA